MRRGSHPPKPEQGSKSPLSRIHMDLCGPMKTVSLAGRKYVLVIVDDFSRYTWTICPSSTKITSSDCQNRFAKTPYHLLFGRIPNIDYYKVFGCPCYVLNETENRGNFGSKSDEMIFVGYSDCSVAYRVLNKKTRVVSESINVKFDPISSNSVSNHGVIADESLSVSSSTTSTATTTELDLLFEYFYDDLYGTIHSSSSVTGLSSIPSCSVTTASEVSPVLSFTSPDPIIPASSPSSADIINNDNASGLSNHDSVASEAVQLDA
ncbi:LOW QUALITY PROTEIN: hypothetical protein OSB04_024227 [Centaurea solstitialis]|uniref:Retroviral polymerase SH3-like domain-containing protein n=1 Tax=Centaurea solstitialis TaxID=347529 RepID=A0AA38WA55_9ASTR|nr:LOW QUALITY PROTEIN: hypothetical protein OSB04_024227 [Centaurea solstitialis]